MAFEQRPEARSVNDRLEDRVEIARVADVVEAEANLASRRWEAEGEGAFVKSLAVAGGSDGGIRSLRLRRRRKRRSRRDSLLRLERGAMREDVNIWSASTSRLTTPPGLSPKSRAADGS